MCKGICRNWSEQDTGEFCSALHRMVGCCGTKSQCWDQTQYIEKETELEKLWSLGIWRSRKQDIRFNKLLKAKKINNKETL